MLMAGRLVSVELEDAGRVRDLFGPDPPGAGFRRGFALVDVPAPEDSG